MLHCPTLVAYQESCVQNRLARYQRSPQIPRAGHINGRLERPDRRQAFSRWVDVRGWAIAQSGDPLALRVTLNGRHLKTIAATEQRADVTAAAHGLAQAPGPVWGFDDVVMLDEQKTPAYAVLTASAISTRNESFARTIGVALLRRQSGRDARCRGMRISRRGIRCRRA